MITEDKEIWKNSVEEDADLEHPLIDTFKYFHVGSEVSIIVDGKPYTRISRALHDENENNIKHINSDRDVLHKIVKLFAVNEKNERTIGYKIVYFRDINLSTINTSASQEGNAELQHTR